MSHVWVTVNMPKMNLASTRRHNEQQYSLRWANKPVNHEASSGYEWTSVEWQSLHVFVSCRVKSLMIFIPSDAVGGWRLGTNSIISTSHVSGILLAQSAMTGEFLMITIFVVILFMNKHATQHDAVLGLFTITLEALKDSPRKSIKTWKLYNVIRFIRSNCRTNI